MKKEIKIQKKNIKYTLKTSRRVKNMRLAVYNNGAMVVTKPYGLPNFFVNYFIRSNATKIINRINSLKKIVNADNKKHYLKNKEEARKIIENKVKEISKYYGLEYNRISIRNQKTRWGSCSAKGNLNFNYKTTFLPDNLIEYIVVHEICHLKEMNHSKSFWNLVENKIPNFKILRKELKVIKLLNIG